MTNKDKNSIDTPVEETALSNVFKRLHKEDSLHPPAALDALILNQAAAAVADDTESVTTASDSKIKQDSSLDIKFRRQQLERERAKQRRKKSFLPIWAMPMGLAAAVLVSFSVVTRVMQSPEFTKPSGSEYMSEIQISDSVTNSVADSDSTELAEALSPMLKTENPVSDIEEKRSDALSKKRSFAPNEQLAPSVKLKESEAKRLQQHDTKQQTERAKARAETKDKQTAFQDIKRDVQMRRAPNRNEVAASEYAHADISKADDSLVISESATKPSVTNITVGVGNVADMESESLQSDGVDVAVDEGLVAEAEAPAPSQVIEEANLSDDTLEEIVVTASRSNKSNNNLISILADIEFEHRTCQSDLDCTLVARNCDSCDCVEALNQESLDLYEIELDDADVTAQCLSKQSECVRNYCQVLTNSIEE